jgi:hypothetical protein
MAICVLCGVIESNHAKENMRASTSFADIHGDVDSYTQGVLAVLYAYSGYNQANYVSFLYFRLLRQLFTKDRYFVRFIDHARTLSRVS